MARGFGRAALLATVASFLFTNVAFAQTSADTLPKCALDCVQSVGSTTTCQTSDLPCLCNSGLFKTGYGLCVLTTCLTETISSPDLLSRLCQGVGPPTTTSARGAATTSPATKPNTSSPTAGGTTSRSPATAATTKATSAATTGQPTTSDSADGTTSAPSQTGTTTPNSNPAEAESNSSNNKSSGGSSLPTAAIVGIVIGIIALVVVAVVMCALVSRRKKAKSYNDDRLTDFFAYNHQPKMYSDTSNLRYEDPASRYEMPYMGQQQQQRSQISSNNTVNGRYEMVG